MAIRAALIFNNHGKPRLTRFYSQLPTARQQALIQRTFALVHRRTTAESGREACNFLDAPELRALLPTTTKSAAASGSGKGKRAGAAGGPIPYDEDVDDRYDASTHGPASSVPRAQYSNSGPGNDTSFSANDSDQLRVIYRHYATLYFIFIVDESESELGILDLIQVFVEALDRVFENVCELDLIFHFDEVHMILNEIIQGGLVLETNLTEIVASARTVAQARRASASNAAGPAAAGLAAVAGGSLSSSGPQAWTVPAGLGGLPWGGAAEWARDWGARFSSGHAGVGGSGLGRPSRRL